MAQGEEPAVAGNQQSQERKEQFWVERKQSEPPYRRATALEQRTEGTVSGQRATTARLQAQRVARAQVDPPDRWGACSPRRTEEARRCRPPPLEERNRQPYRC